MPLTIVRNDITKMRVDAIVNAANTELKNYAPHKGGGVCGEIFRAAGNEKLQAVCDKLAPVKTGKAVLTPGFKLPAKYIIHTPGPKYIDGNHSEKVLLRSCYVNSLEIAKKKGCKSIAFPLISSGIYGYPKDEALSVATNSIGDWLYFHDFTKNGIDVSLVVFDKTAFEVSLKHFGDVTTFIDENYVGDYDNSENIRKSQTFSDVSESVFEFQTEMKAEQLFVPQKKQPRVQVTPPPAASITLPFHDLLDEPFFVTLLRLIDAKGKTDIQVYKRANIDRKLFSKIRAGKNYMPSKKTVVALAVALELSILETKKLLQCAGFALSRSVMFDVIVEYFIRKGKFDIFEINNVLFAYDQPLLGG